MPSNSLGGGSVLLFAISLVSLLKYFVASLDQLKLGFELSDPRRLVAVLQKLDGLVLHLTSAGAKVLELGTIDNRQRFRSVDVERTKLGTLALGQERQVVERRPRLGLLLLALNCWYCLENRSA